MSVRSFKSVGLAAAVGAAALGCYMVSLNVASERAELAKVEREILLAKRDIRALQTELGTRGRLQQLEQWNAEVLALSAPMPGQFIDSQVRLANLEVPHSTIDDRAAEVRLASAEAVEHVPAKPAIAFKPVPQAIPDKPLVHRASLVLPAKSPLSSVKPVEVSVAPTKAQPVKVAKAEQPKPQQPKAEPAKAPSPKGQVAKADARSQPVKAAATKPAAATAAKKPEPVKSAASARPRSSTGLIDEGLLGEINAVASKERKGAGAR